MSDNDYIVQGEPKTKTKAKNWKTAIGLQQVDNLTPSEYLIQTANSNINGEITLDEAEERINTYYEEQGERHAEARQEEADKVSLAITKILSERAFSFGVNELLAIHRRLFNNVSDMQVYAGKIRDCNISKKEWVLNDTSVYYAHFENIREELDYDFEKESNFDYKVLTKRQIAHHIAGFVSDIWQIHPFREGNTRAVAVFAVKYLRTFGFDIDNELFEDKSWYFRNALVRANYRNYNEGVFETAEYLNMFFENLLLGGKHKLKNRDMHINRDTDKVPINNTDKQKQVILDIISANNEVTTKSLCPALNVGEERIKKLLQQLVKEEKIVALGSNKNRTYRLNKNLCKSV